MRSGRDVVLGAEIARGGEGAIYAIPSLAASLAKIFHAPPEANKAGKLMAMAKADAINLGKVSAWPTDVLLDRGGSVRGFVMPRVGSRSDAHELYSPKSRASAFPEADFRFLVHVATNLARAFANVHAERHVIGDINHGHVLVGQDGRVVLIDVDSFQVTLEGKTFTCDVGVPLFTAPELQGQSFKGLFRTPSHDAFGLAVTLFHLLFMGRHPFAGVWSGTGEMPIEKAIREGRFAYSANASVLGMKRPPGSIALDTFGPRLAEQFERAFRSQIRPSAADWVDSLQSLAGSLRACSATVSHQYPQALAACPWCAVEAATGARLFGHRLSGGTTGAVDISALWRAIERVPAPPTAPPLPSDVPWRPPAGVEMPATWLKPSRIAAAVTLAAGGVAACSSIGHNGGWVGFGGLVLAFLAWPRVAPAMRSEADQALANARREWDALKSRWDRDAADGVFASVRKELETAKAQLADLPNERNRRMAKLKSAQQAFQHRRHLDRFRIDRASIPGIGPGRAATLAAFGVETAYDVDDFKIHSIHGFGPKLCSALIAWRMRHEMTFRFNPSEPIDPGEIRRVEGEIAAIQQRCSAQLNTGAARLQRLGAEMVSARERLAPKMKESWDQLKLAEARRRAL